jgi:hypothetical protein
MIDLPKIDDWVAQERRDARRHCIGFAIGYAMLLPLSEDGMQLFAAVGAVVFLIAALVAMRSERAAINAAALRSLGA